MICSRHLNQHRHQEYLLNGESVTVTFDGEVSDFEDTDTKNGSSL